MDALLDLPMVLTLDQVGRMGDCLGPDRAAAALCVADEIASAGWMPYLFAGDDAAPGALPGALLAFTRRRTELLEIVGQALSLEEVAIFRVSWARRLVGGAVISDGDGSLAAPMPRVLDEFEAVASLATGLPAVRGRSVPELRRAAARVDFCLGAVLQFGGGVARRQRPAPPTTSGLRPGGRAQVRIVELARQALAAARQLRARLLTRRVQAGQR